MGKASRDKGKRGEREAAKELAKVLGCSARRGVQYQGGPGSPDVVVDIQGLHIEVKRTEAFRMWDALEQAYLDKPLGSAPVVLHRKNLKPWVAIVHLDDLPALAKAISQYMKEQADEQE